MISPQLIATLDKLPPPLQAEILHYAEYLAAKYAALPRKQKLLDDEIYRSWLSDLEDVVQKHNLEVLSSGIQNVFVGDFGRHLSQLRAKARRNAV
ncbi:MAG: DUF2281 domain-containing protein [Microcystis aeruginosa W13-11]|nr:DUF2281 domain-containing protein [Microcystis aeruginosa W13-11]